MGWYRVVKTIKGHRYIYEQRTWREGKHVRTESRYIGPADDSIPLGPIAGEGPRPPKRATQDTAAVNTTSAFNPVFVEETFDALTVALPNSQAWTKPWRTRRKGPNLVQH